MNTTAGGAPTPIFVVAGMFRSGTTFLYHKLQEHPGICASYRKESDYFGVNHHRGVEWFQGLYSHRKPDQTACDISPCYAIDEDAIERIQAYAPNTKVIICFRNPAEVALSLHKQMQTIRGNVPPFEEFVRSYQMPKGDGQYDIRFADGQLARTVAAFKEALGRNLLLYDYASFKKAPLETLQMIEAFVGLAPHFTAENFTNTIVNASSRRNSRLVMFLMSHEPLIRFMEKALPLAVNRTLLNIYYLWAKPRTRQEKPAGEDKDEALAKKLLAGDEDYRRRLFAEASYVLGDGTPFRPGSRKAQA